MNMKRYLSGLAILLILMMVLAACGGGNPSGGGGNATGSSQETGGTEAGNQTAQVFDLNFNIATSPTHPYVTELAQPWADYVREKTNGRVNVHLFPNVALGPHNQTFHDISAGVYDLGIIVAGLHTDTEMFPMSISDLPFGITDPYVAMEVMTKFKDKYMNDVFGKGATFLSVSATDTYQLVTKKPVEKMEDIKNMKINSNLQGVIDVLKQWGAVPVTIPNTDIYESLERGILDGAVYTGSGVVSFKFYEIAPYMTITDFAGASQIFVISTETFNRLPEDIQKMFLEDFGPRYASMLADLYVRLPQNAFDTFEKQVQAKNGRIIRLSDEEQNRVRAAGKSTWENWVNEANNRGYPGDEMMADFKAWLKEAGNEVPF